MEKIISTNSMNKRDIKNFTKSQLIKLLLKQSLEIEKLSSKIEKLSSKNVKPPLEFQDDYKPIPALRTKKQVPTPFPRKSVKQMVQEYEDNIIPPPLEFKDDYKPIPKPRTKKQVPAPLPRTKIEQVANALKGYTQSFEIGIKNNKDPLIQLQNTRNAIEKHIKNIIKSKKG